MLKIVRVYHHLKTKQKIIRVICAATLLWAMAYACFEYFVPLFLEGKGYSISTIGLLLGIPSFIAIGLDVFIGYLQTKIKAKWLFLFSLTLLIAASLLIYLYGGMIGIIIFALVLYGLGFDFFDITNYSSVFRNSDETNSSSNISLRDTFEALGLVIGGIFVGYAFSENPGQTILITALFMFLSFLIILFLYKEPWRNSEIKVKNKWLSVITDFKKIRSKQMLFVLFVMVCITFWDGLFWGFESIFANKFVNPYINESVFAGMLMAIYLLPMVLFEHLFGIAEDRIGKKKFIYGGFLVLAIGITLIAISQNIFLLTFAVFLTSTGIFAITWPAILGWYEDKTALLLGRNNAGKAVGIIEFFENIGYLLGPIFGGLIVLKLGFQGTFFIMGGLFLVLAITSFFVLKK
ncbi:MFS transporter [Candidatus Woesearchaeota archaeon]|nr:MAG: MFS transporter [Candidatus Woesearchaeota archaeon]